MATSKAQDSSGAPEMSSSSSDKKSSCCLDSPSMASKDEEMSIPEMPSLASSKGESSAPVESPPGTSKDGEEIDFPEMPSLASSKEESSFPVESPPVTSKEGVERDVPEMPSPASGKEESSFPFESPPGTSKDGEEIDIPEMPRLASSKEESSAPVESPPGTSKRDGDEIDILSSNTESPPLISTVYSSCSQATTESESSCLKCFDIFCTIIDSRGCIKKKRANLFNFVTLIVGFLVLLIAYFLLKHYVVSVFWECLYGSILLIYCSLLSCCVGRGCCSQSPCIKRDPSRTGCFSGGGCVEIISPAFRQRKIFYSNASVSEEESSKDEVLAAIQADTPEHESNVEMDIAENPGTSSVRVEIAIIE